MKHASLGLLIVILCIFMLPTYIGMGKSDFSTPPQKWHEACQWIKNNTPQDALIIAWWDYGYWIEYLAGREAYIDGGQNKQRVTEIARLLLSHKDCPEFPEGNVYLAINYDTAYNFKRPLAIWAIDADERFVSWEKTLVQRLYSGQYDLNKYRLVYDNDIKIWEVIK